MNRLRKLVYKDKLRCLSLDVFDTLLLRNNSSELKRFYEVSCLQKLMLEKKGYFFSVEELFRVRCTTHNLGYRVAPLVQFTREGRLDQMFSMLCQYLKLPREYVTKLIQCEIEYESKVLTPNYPLIEIAKEAKEAGLLLVVTSDMYLSKEAMAQLLSIAVPDLKFDSIFVSSDNGVAKHSSGLLYEIVAKHLKITLESILHVGDNYYADYLQALSVGVNALHLPVSPANKVLRKLNKKYQKHILS